MAGTTALVSIGMMVRCLRLFCAGISLFDDTTRWCGTMTAVVFVNDFCTRKRPFTDIDKGQQDDNYVENLTHHPAKLHLLSHRSKYSVEQRRRTG